MKNWLIMLREIVTQLWRLRPFLRPGRWLVISVVASALVAAVLEGFVIAAMLPLITMLRADAGNFKNVLEAEATLRWLPNALPGHSPKFYVGVFCATIFLLVAGKNVVILLSQGLMARLVRTVSANLRSAVFQKLEHTSIQVFEERKGGELGNLFSIETIRTQSTIEFFLMFIQRGLLALLYLAAIVVISWELTLGMVLLVVGVAAISAVLQARLKGMGDERSEAQRNLFGFLGGIFGGMRVVRATHGEAEAEKRFEQYNQRLADVEARAAVLNSLTAPVSEVLAIGGAMVLVWGAYVYLILYGRLSGPMLGSFGILLLRMLPLMNHLYAVLGNLGYASGGMREIFVWLDLPRFPARPFGSKPFHGIQRSIRIETLSFHYPNGTAALKEVNLEIPAGKTVALVGSSGSGKSTLASLLLRLREPSSGRIVVDGTDYWEFDPAAWHARLGMVEQEAFLFNETIEHNITFGTAGATPEQVQKALRVAHLDEVVAGLPKGLHTLVGERGTMLSGGQKQRLAIARAMVREPMLLILDEATSALDNVSERQVQAALDDARRGRTSVVIAHRLSTIRNADLIVVLAGGRIVETGTWAELEAREGHFRELLSAARGGHLAEAG